MPPGGRSPIRVMKLKWAQRRDLVFLSFEVLDPVVKDATVLDQSVDIAFESPRGISFAVPLSRPIVSEESQRRVHGRGVSITLKKTTPEWWETISNSAEINRLVKTDFDKWCDEEDPEYSGATSYEMADMDECGDFGGLGDWNGDDDDDETDEDGDEEEEDVGDDESTVVDDHGEEDCCVAAHDGLCCGGEEGGGGGGDGDPGGCVDVDGAERSPGVVDGDGVLV